MIVRTWHGCVPLQHAEGFARHLELTGVEHARASPATEGAGAPENRGEWAHFFLATYWQDLAAVKAFAGEDYHVAVTYPDDEAFELLSDPMCFSMKSRPCRRCRLMTGQVEDWPAAGGCWLRESDVYLVWAASRRWVNVA